MNSKEVLSGAVDMETQNIDMKLAYDVLKQGIGRY